MQVINGIDNCLTRLFSRCSVEYRYVIVEWTISEVLEQHVDGGRVIPYCCMWVDIHGYGWFGAGMEVDDGMYAELCHLDGHMSGHPGALPECEVVH